MQVKVEKSVIIKAFTPILIVLAVISIFIYLAYNR